MKKKQLKTYTFELLLKKEKGRLKKNLAFGKKIQNNILFVQSKTKVIG